MFARNTFFRLRSLDMSDEFLGTFEHELLPLLRNQKGFLGELLMANPGSLDRIAISLWESRADADTYNRHVYPQVLKILAGTIIGRPQIQTFDSITFSVINNTGATNTVLDRIAFKTGPSLPS